MYPVPFSSPGPAGGLPLHGLLGSTPSIGALSRLSKPLPKLLDPAVGAARPPPALVRAAALLYPY